MKMGLIDTERPRKSVMWKKNTRDLADAVEVRTYQPGSSLTVSKEIDEQVRAMAENIVADVNCEVAEHQETYGQHRSTGLPRKSKVDAARSYIAALTESLLPRLGAMETLPSTPDKKRKSSPSKSGSS